MIDALMDFLHNLPPELAVLSLSALPISELRGGIPLGFALNLPPFEIFGLAVVGNLIPAIPLLWLLNPLSNWLRRFKLADRFFVWLFERSKRKAGIIEKYEAIGLILFVAIPLPMTGLWTGAIAASLFKIRFRWALLSLIIGVLIAACIVTTLCMTGKMFLTPPVIETFK